MLQLASSYPPPDDSRRSWAARWSRMAPPSPRFEGSSRRRARRFAMRWGNRSLALSAVLIGVVAAHAGGQRQAPSPRAIPPGGPSVDLTKLDDPVRLEQRLRAAVRSGNGPLRLTVSNGLAYFGDYSVPADASQDGNLLVLRGDADLFGRVSGNRSEEHTSELQSRLHLVC